MEQIGKIVKQRANIILQGFDPLSAGGFTQIPNFILKAKNISPGAKLCYAMLLSYAWHNECCYPGQSRLAKDMGSGQRTVVRYLSELEKKKYLKTQRRGQGHTNIYVLYCRVK